MCAKNRDVLLTDVELDEGLIRADLRRFKIYLNCSLDWPRQSVIVPVCLGEH